LWPRTAVGSETLRVGVIGCGARGTHLIRTLARKGVAVAAVCDAFEPHAARAAALSGATRCRRVQDLIGRADIDGVVVATPDHTHASISMAALESDKDVYCEPPMALNLSEAAAFRACAVRTGRIVQIGFDGVGLAAWRIARDLIRQGVPGELLWCRGGFGSDQRAEDYHATPAGVTADAVDWAAFLGNAPRRAFDADRFINWTYHWEYSAGVAVSALYPKLAALVFATNSGLPSAVSAAGGVRSRNGGETPDSFVIDARYPPGYRLVLASVAGRGIETPAVIRGREATVEVSNRAVAIWREGSCVAETVQVRDSQDLLDEWLGCVQSRRPCLCNPEFAFRALAPAVTAVDAYRAQEA
jgi:predicted dehydrogenase